MSSVSFSRFLTYYSDNIATPTVNNADAHDCRR
jgi:hypothetical protein